MAVGTGFSKPYVAKYTANAGTVTYSGGMPLGRGVSVSLEVDTPDDNNFYADNVLAESESGVFVSGSATVTVDGLNPEVVTTILGAASDNTVTIPGVETPVAVQSYDDDVDPAYVGFGYIRRTMMQGVTSYIPTVLTKVKFSIPGEEAETSEDQIGWQTQELAATVQRADDAKHQWRLIFAAQPTEAEAYAIITGYLGGGTSGN